MSRTVDYVKATPERVFQVLTDPFTYDYWVVGCKTIRHVDQAWPQPGAAFHHSVGIGPVTSNDRTCVVEVRPPALLRLEAHGWPAGRARVTLRLEGHDDRTRVTLEEEPLSGPARWLHNPLLDAAAHTRNAVALRRLARVAEHRL